MRASALLCVGLGVGTLCCAPAQAQLTRSATSAVSSGLQSAIADFRLDLGQLNPYQARSFLTGRREINWDDIPDALATPAMLSGDYYNTVSPRGVVLSTPGTGLLVSAAAGNPSGTPVNFGDVNSAYLAGLAPFSGPRMMAAAGSIQTTINFVVPGSTIPSLSRGFGAVFSDVDELGPTRLQFFDVHGGLLLDLAVPATRGDATFSFIGASYPTPVVASVRVIAGTVPLNTTSGSVFGLPTVDVVAIDDLIFGEPIPAPEGGVLLGLAAITACRRRR